LLSNVLLADKIQWHASQADFGTATITTTGKDGKPTPTVIPQGFLVALDAQGKVEITFSQWLKDQLADIAAQLPTCAPVKRRAWNPRKHQAVGRQVPPVAECPRLRTARVNQILRQRPAVMNQMVRLNEEVARVTGNDALALAESDQMMTFANEDITLEIIEYTEYYVVEEVTEAEAIAAEESLAAAGLEVLGVLASFAFFVSILTDLWKLKADPQPMPIFQSRPKPTTTRPASCPTSIPACAGLRCAGGFDGECTREWKGCDCNTSHIAIGDPNIWGEDYAAVEDLIYAYVFGPDLDNSDEVPAPKCSAGTAEDNNLANVETSVWTQYVTSGVKFQPSTVANLSAGSSITSVRANQPSRVPSNRP
jgi:hypothetical protein